MPRVLDEIGLSWLPHYAILRVWFTRISTKTWRPFLDASAEKRTGHAAIDSTGFNHDQPSRHSANCTLYSLPAQKASFRCQNFVFY